MLLVLSAAISAVQAGSSADAFPNPLGKLLTNRAQPNFLTSLNKDKIMPLLRGKFMAPLAFLEQPAPTLDAFDATEFSQFLEIFASKQEKISSLLALKNPINFMSSLVDLNADLGDIEANLAFLECDDATRPSFVNLQEMLSNVMDAAAGSLQTIIDNLDFTTTVKVEVGDYLLMRKLQIVELIETTAPVAFVNQLKRMRDESNFLGRILKFMVDKGMMYDNVKVNMLTQLMAIKDLKNLKLATMKEGWSFAKDTIDLKKLMDVGLIDLIANKKAVLDSILTTKSPAELIRLMVGFAEEFNLLTELHALASDTKAIFTDGNLSRIMDLVDNLLAKQLNELSQLSSGLVDVAKLKEMLTIDGYLVKALFKIITAKKSAMGTFLVTSNTIGLLDILAATQDNFLAELEQAFSNPAAPDMTLQEFKNALGVGDIKRLLSMVKTKEFVDLDRLEKMVQMNTELVMAPFHLLKSGKDSLLFAAMSPLASIKDNKSNGFMTAMLEALDKSQNESVAILGELASQSKLRHGLENAMFQFGNFLQTGFTAENVQFTNALKATTLIPSSLQGVKAIFGPKLAAFRSASFGDLVLNSLQRDTEIVDLKIISELMLFLETKTFDPLGLLNDMNPDTTRLVIQDLAFLVNVKSMVQDTPDILAEFIATLDDKIMSMELIVSMLSKTTLPTLITSLQNHFDTFIDIEYLQSMKEFLDDKLLHPIETINDWLDPNNNIIADFVTYMGTLTSYLKGEESFLAELVAMLDVRSTAGMVKSMLSPSDLIVFLKTKIDSPLSSLGMNLPGTNLAWEICEMINSGVELSSSTIIEDLLFELENKYLLAIREKGLAIASTLSIMEEVIASVKLDSESIIRAGGIHSTLMSFIGDKLALPQTLSARDITILEKIQSFLISTIEHVGLFGKNYDEGVIDQLLVLMASFPEFDDLLVIQSSVLSGVVDIMKEYGQGVIVSIMEKQGGGDLLQNLRSRSAIKPDFMSDLVFADFQSDLLKAFTDPIGEFEKVASGQKAILANALASLEDYVATMRGEGAIVSSMLNVVESKLVNLSSDVQMTRDDIINEMTLFFEDKLAKGGLMKSEIANIENTVMSLKKMLVNDLVPFTTGKTFMEEMGAFFSDRSMELVGASMLIDDFVALLDKKALDLTQAGTIVAEIATTIQSRSASVLPSDKTSIVSSFLSFLREKGELPAMIEKGLNFESILTNSAPLNVFTRINIEDLKNLINLDVLKASMASTVELALPKQGGLTASRIFAPLAAFKQASDVRVLDILNKLSSPGKLTEQYQMYPPQYRPKPPPVSHSSRPPISVGLTNSIGKQIGNIFGSIFQGGQPNAGNILGSEEPYAFGTLLTGLDPSQFGDVFQNASPITLPELTLAPFTELFDPSAAGGIFDLFNGLGDSVLSPLDAFASLFSVEQPAETVELISRIDPQSLNIPEAGRRAISAFTKIVNLTRLPLRVLQI